MGQQNPSRVHASQFHSSQFHRSQIHSQIHKGKTLS